jgi:hypothetical protein
LPCLAALSSCAGDGSTLDPMGAPLGPPRILVIPTAVSLSLVEESSLVVEVTVTNAGGLPLAVQEISSAQPFIRPRFDGPVELRAEKSLGVRVEIAAEEPAPATVEGTVEIASNDPDQPIAIVAVRLEITPTPVPEIDVSPASLSLVLVEGTSDVRSLKISNLGSADLVVSDVSSSSAFLSVAGAPAVVAPAESATVSVVVHADVLPPGLHSGAIDVASNDADEPVVQVPVALEVTWAGPFPATLAAIQANVFTPTCALSFCHGAAMSANLNLLEGSSFDNLVGQESAEVAGVLRVDPFRPDDSYLVCKLENCAWIVGTQMPVLGGPLDPSVIGVIRRWISEGALDN